MQRKPESARYIVRCNWFDERRKGAQRSMPLWTLGTWPEETRAKAIADALNEAEERRKEPFYFYDYCLIYLLASDDTPF